MRAIRAAASRATSASTTPAAAIAGEGRAALAAVAAKGGILKPELLFVNSGAQRGYGNLVAAAAFIPALAYSVQDQQLSAAELERTFIAIKPDGIQRGLISDIVARFEKKGYKLVGIRLVHPSKEFAEKHYDDLKEQPFFKGLIEFLSSGPVVAMVWEGQGVIKYGRKMIGATNPSASEPGTIRGDYAIAVGRNIIHGSDGPETTKAEIDLWFKSEELMTYTKDTEKWVYEWSDCMFCESSQFWAISSLLVQSL